MIQHLSAVTERNTALKNLNQIILNQIYVTVSLWPVYLYHFIFSPLCLLTGSLQNKVTSQSQPHKVFRSFSLCVCLPWDVAVALYCHTAVFIPGCFSFRVTAQCHVLQITKQRTVNSDYRASQIL